MGTINTTPAFFQWNDGHADHIFALDATTNETHVYVSQIAEHPVESGVNIADNVNQLSDELTIDGIVSDTPITSVRPVKGLKNYPMTNQPLDISTSSVQTYSTQNVPITWPKPTVITATNGGQVGSAFNAIGGLSRPSSFKGQIASLSRPNYKQVTTLQATEDFDPIADALLALKQLKEGAYLTEVYTPKCAYQDMVLTNIAMTRSSDSGTSVAFSLNFKRIRLVSSKVVIAPAPTEVRAVPQVNKGNQPAAAPVSNRETIAAYLSGVGK